MGKIVKLSEINKLVLPNKATLVGGIFDLFHVGHLRYLRVVSQVGRPLIVIIQTDKMVSIRKGPTRPIINQEQRAEIISALEFVDFVLILDKPSHCDRYLEIIRPRRLIFFEEGLRHRKRRALEVKKKFPEIKIVFIGKKEVGNKVMSTTRIAKKILKKPTFDKIKNPIVKELYNLAALSQARVGKISAIIVQNGKIVQKSKNTKDELHAEAIAIKLARNKVDLTKCELYILIPPCIVCSELILKTGIKKVYYLHPYGNDDGLRLLRKKGILVKKIKPA